MRDEIDEDRELGLPPLPERLQPPARRRPVAPFAPRRGWAQADTARRAFALSALVIAPALFFGPFRWVAMAWLAPTLAPPAYYSMARVLRPARRSAPRSRLDDVLITSDELRHWTAAVATALATPVLSMLLFWKLGFDIDEWPLALLLYLGIPALFLGVVTLLWGAAAHLRR
ncbi:hypothetical protein ACPPVT_03590 [Angustibacter sp. McL0619]|uniref:hypothetical protein n=1 Tax=Angustibacter sp. McL0619 TaxID=3415676 RepID=UPI003CF44CC6